jgi:hypothetical protein
MKGFEGADAVPDPGAQICQLSFFLHKIDFLLDNDREGGLDRKRLRIRGASGGFVPEPKEVLEAAHETPLVHVCRELWP